MARPKRGTHKIPTEIRILTSAEQVFGECGYERTRLEDIAAQAGIRRPSLLYHFPTKEKLYSVVVHQVFDALRKSLTSVMLSGPLYVQVERLTLTLLEFTEERPAFAPIVVREVVDGRGPIREILHKEIAPLLTIVEEWLKQQGKDEIPASISVRNAILQIASDIILRASSGPLKTTLWGPDTRSSLQLANQLFSHP